MLNFRGVQSITSWNNSGIWIPIIECWPKESADLYCHSCGPSQFFFPECGNPNFESNKKKHFLLLEENFGVETGHPEVLSNHLPPGKKARMDGILHLDPGKLHFENFQPMCCQWYFEATKTRPKGDQKKIRLSKHGVFVGVFQHGVVQKALSSISLQGILNMFCAICMAPNQKRDDTDSPWQHQLAKRASA